MLRGVFNRFSLQNNAPCLPASDQPFPNIHADKLFLIKIQRSLSPGEGTLFIYDRQRSIEVLVMESADQALFERLRAEITGSRGGYKGLKMYRWAKRTGDFEFSVCLDRMPQEAIKW